MSTFWVMAVGVVVASNIGSRAAFCCRAWDLGLSAGVRHGTSGSGRLLHSAPPGLRGQTFAEGPELLLPLLLDTEGPLPFLRLS